MKITLLLCAFLLMLSLVSCEEVVVLDTGRELPIVVNCVLSRDSVQVLTIYRLPEYGNENKIKIDSLEAKLFRTDAFGKPLDGTWVRFKRKNDFEWTADYVPEFGIGYRLELTLSSGEHIYATTQFPPDLKLYFYPKFLNDYQWNLLSDDQRKLLSEYTANAPSSQCEDFFVDYMLYTAVIMQGRTVAQFKDGEKIVKSVYNEPTNLPCTFWVFPHIDAVDDTPQPYSDYIATDHPGVDDFNQTEIKLAEMPWCNIPILIMDELGRRPEDKNWQSWLSDRGKLWQENFYFTNIAQWYRILTPDIPLHKGFLRISHPAFYDNGLSEEKIKNSCYFSSKCFILVADYCESYGLLFDGNHGYGQMPHTNEIHFVSEEYDNYLRDVYLAKQKMDDFILSAYELKEIYSNINGGLGIFGADNKTWDEIQFIPEARSRFTIYMR